MYFQHRRRGWDPAALYSGKDSSGLNYSRAAHPDSGLQRKQDLLPEMLVMHRTGEREQIKNVL